MPKGNTQQTPATPAASDPLDATNLPCLCGCEQETVRAVARFLPGHDAKLRALVLRGRLRVEAVPAVALPFFQNDPEPVAGLVLEGSFLRDTKRKPTTKLSGSELQKLADEAKAKEAKEAAKATKAS